MAANKMFEGQVAIVTGGAQGLGGAIAAMLQRNGAKVMVFDMKPVVEGASPELSSCVVDVRDEESVVAGFKKTVELWGRVDIMVNCAGIVGPHSATADIVDVAEFDKVYQVNVRGSFLMTKHSLVEMKKRNYGRILLIASIAGKEGNAGMCAYSSSKAAVIGLVKSVGKENAESGITVNALAPAVVMTPMVEAMDPAQVKYMTDKIPMKRCCSLDEVASITQFIVSQEASFNTGVCFDLTGGRATY
ncbi:2-dehydro-3-deoxy-L-rhamnonate dehydrogenase (NAD(+))-like isoform X2 [Halichondria panicea]|uniref:2-dehydro-3-deoxy-L-rhamnonate dehydrogenase (NAD(+))-like isoform X2 n=1 Tax=Halichondria panicea TaxID=6063 RepID=UPI00312B58EA